LVRNPDSQPSTFTPPLENRSIPFLIFIGLFGLGLGFLISILDPFTYNEKVRLLAPPALKNSALSLITIMALIVALLVQPVIGQWSDRTRSRWGRRRPYLVSGVVGLSFSLALVVVADHLWLLIVAAMLTSASSNTVQGTWQALIPDYVPQSQRGTAAGIKTLLELIGVIVGVTLIGTTLARGNLWAGPLTTMGLFWLILLMTLSTMRQSDHEPDSKPTDQPKDEVSHVDPPLTKPLLVYSLIRSVPGFPWWMLNRFLFWSSAIAIRTFILNYMEDVLLLSPAEAQILSSRIFVLLGIGVLFLALPAGVITDRLGRQPVLVAAGLLAASGAILLIFLRQPNQLFMAGGLIAAGGGIFVSTSWALATDLAPETKGALYLGLANGATVLGSIGGRLGGPLIDGLNQVTGTSTTGYLVVFAIAALFFGGSSLVVLKIPRR
jgi:MFS family permease